MTNDPSTTLPRPFIHLAWANLAAQSAEQVSLAAVPIVAVMALGAGPGEIGTLAAMQSLPFLLLSLPAGVLADRWSRRRLMLGAELLRALALAALLLATLSGQLSIALLAVLGFLGATGTVAFSVAAPAAVPAMVPRTLLAAANGRLELARALAYAGGPAVAGALVSWAGAPSAFVLAVMLSVAALLLLWRLPEGPRVDTPRRAVMHELLEGAQFVWQHTLLRPVLLTAVAWNLAWFALQAVYVPYAIKALHLSAGAVGATMAGLGAGMLLGALFAARVMRSVSFGTAVVLGPIGSLLAALVMAATLLWPSGWLAALSWFMFGVGPVLWVISSATLRQTVTPGTKLGQVGAIFLTVNTGVRPLGAALGGAVGEHWGYGAALWLVVFGFAVQLWLIWHSPVRRLHQLPNAHDAVPTAVR
jgi:predicted MFS family arabinose efflux permease